MLLPIFGNERCVATKEALRIAAETASRKAGATTTPGAEIEGQNSLLNAQSVPPQSAITYPARPISGGRLDLAPRKTGAWFAEPKYNGWRALVHTPTGTLWNRHGKRLSIAAEFGPALRELRGLARHGLVWADCEALERRHAIGRGSLVVLDWICETGAPGYEERRDFLATFVEIERLSLGEWISFPENAVLLSPSIRDEGDAVMQFYAGLREINRHLKADFFEGVVMKRGGSPYPVQLRSETEECRAWCKHRFLS
jgi:ATP-dependent DNA ligase